MQPVIKTFLLVVILLIAAFFANYFGVVSIPWLDINPVPTYGDDAARSDKTVKKVFND